MENVQKTTFATYMKKGVEGKSPEYTLLEHQNTSCIWDQVLFGERSV